MKCPACHAPDSRVLDSRPRDYGVRRRRQCSACGHRFTTRETLAIRETGECMALPPAPLGEWARQTNDANARCV